MWQKNKAGITMFLMILPHIGEKMRTVQQLFNYITNLTPALDGSVSAGR
jgi:hypothetical protein